MTLKQVVKELNKEDTRNAFRISELAAKRDRKNEQEWVIVQFINQRDWRDFSAHKVTLYEALPPGWPLSEVAQRLNCSTKALGIISRFSVREKRWVKISDAENFYDEMTAREEKHQDRLARQYS